MLKRIMVCIALFWSLLVVDQVTKYGIATHFQLGESLELLPWFSFTYVRNQGAAWGMFQGSQFYLAGFGCVAIVLMIIFWKKIFGSSWLHCLTAASLFSGIVGNLIDRIRLGYVIDFADFHWGIHHFPCFNVADSAICLSVLTLLIVQMVTEHKTAKTKESATE